MNKGIFTIVFCLVVGYVFGQSVGDYQSRSSGNWSQANRWQVFYNGAWRNLETNAAGPYKNVLPTSASGAIQITSGTFISVSATTNANQLVVANGATLRVNANRVLTIVNDVTTPLRVDGGVVVNNNGVLDLQSLLTNIACQINGYIQNNGVISISNPALLSFNTGSVYQHLHRTGGAIPLATWGANSTCYISGMNSANPTAPANLGQTFWDFTWNTPSMGATTSFSFAGALKTVNGNLTFVSTGGTPREVRLANGGAGNSLTIAGNFIIQGGTVTLSQNQTTATTVSINGNLNISGGTLNLGNANNSAINVLLNGNFVKTGGLINRGSGAGAGTIRFDGGLQTYTNNVAIASAVNFSVENGSNLNLGTSALTGTGTFTLNAGATLQVGSLDAGGAIQAGTAGGNIRVSGVRTYQSNSDIIYNGAGIQYMASGQPAAPNTTIANLNDVFMVSNVAINGALNLVDGLLGLENFTLTINGIYDRTNGFVGIIPGSSINIQGSGFFDDLVLYDYFGAGAINNFTLNRSGLTVTQGIAVLTINGTYTQLAGNYSLNSFAKTTLNLRGQVNQATGTSIFGGTDDDDTFEVSGSGGLPGVLNLTGTFNTIRMNRNGIGLSMGTPVTTRILNLRDGTFAPAGFLTVQTGGRIIREFGNINAAPLAQTTYDVEYAAAFNTTTGLELPTDNTTLDSLILNNTFQVSNPTGGGQPYILSLATPVFVNGSLLVTEGNFATNDNAINIRRNFVVGTNGVFQQGLGTVTFDGPGTAQLVTAATLLTLYNVDVNQAPASSVTVGSALDIQNQISVTSASTVAAGSDLLRLLSTPTRTAYLAPVLSGGTVSGSVVVQRYLPKADPISSFYYLGSPVINSTVADWRLELPIPNVYRWNEPTRKYVAYSLSGGLPSGLGLSVKVNSASTLTTDVRGTLRIGPLGVGVTSQSSNPLSDDGWNLIGNPYPSAIDWDNMSLPAGIENAVYITDNFNNSGQGSGVQRVAYVNGVGTPASYDGRIAQGQAFWVKATANTTLNFTESAKSSTNDSQFYRKGEVPNVLRIVMEGAGLSDEAVIRITEGASSKFDGKYDAHKFFEGDFKLSTLTSDNIKAAINALGTSDCATPVLLVLEGVSAGEYQFSFNGLESFEGEISIVLEDLLENKIFSVGSEEAYPFTISDNNIESLASRFRITLSAPDVNTLVKANGESLCDDKATALITIKDSEPGVRYSATWKGEAMTGTETGTGSTIQLVVNTATLDAGENAITVWAASGLCSQAALVEKPVVTKVMVGKISSVSDGIICNEGPATLIATGAAEGGFYNWYEDATSETPIAGQQTAQFTTPVLTKTKTYYVAAVNSLGCESDRVAVRAVVSYPENVTLTLINSLTMKSSHESGNEWYLNDVKIEGETSNVLQATEPGIYTLVVNQGGCAMSASREISELAFEGGTNVEPIIKIYPNPTQNKVFIQVRSKNESVKATIMSSTGIEMDSRSLVGDNGIKQGEFDLLPYATGIYNIRIMDGSKLSIKKIAKVK